MGTKGKNKKKPKQIKTKKDTNTQEGKSSVMSTVATALNKSDEKTKPSRRKGN